MRFLIVLIFYVNNSAVKQQQIITVIKVHSGGFEPKSGGMALQNPTKWNSHFRLMTCICSNFFLGAIEDIEMMVH